MFQFLYIFGPAAITYLIVSKLSRRSAPDFFTGLVELIACAVLDAALTTCILLPFGRVELVFNSEGIRDIRYGVTAFLLSLVISVIAGVAIAAIAKRTEIQLQITRKEAPEEPSDNQTDERKGDEE